MRAAGAILVGKANLDQFATGLVGTRSPYGTPPNVLDPALVPGGSSSGSAVAVALGLVPFALGTDTAGSGRVPAALNGVVGLKPTVGRMSTRGVVPAVRSLDCPSVFARTVADAAAVAAVMDVVAAATRRPVPSSRRRRWPGRRASACRPHGPRPPPRTSRWPRGSTRSIDRLAALGCAIVPIDIEPHLELGRLLYGSALVAERAAAVGDLVAKEVDGLDPVVAGIIARAADHAGVDVYRAEHACAEARRAVAASFADIDVLALPTTLATVSLAEVHDDPVGRNQFLGTLTTFVNLADLACVTVPMAAGHPRRAAAHRAGVDRRRARRAGRGLRARRVADARTGVRVVVVGAHLAGQPLNHQLTHRRAVLRRLTTTSPDYRLYALAGTVPPKPGLVRVADDGAAIEVELWAITPADLGSFLLDVPPPLAIGSVRAGRRLVVEGLRLRAAGARGGDGHHPHRRVAAAPRREILTDLTEPVDRGDRVRLLGEDSPRGGTMQYVMLIIQGTTPTPQSPSWATLSEAEQQAVYADYAAINKDERITPACRSACRRTPRRSASRTARY